MRRFKHPAALLTACLVVLSATDSLAQEGSLPKSVSARSKLTDDEISNMKSSRYEVERSEIKYQPYIITYDDQELVQLVYDTRKEARPASMKSTTRTGSIGSGSRESKIRKWASVRSSGSSTKPFSEGVWRSSPRSWGPKKRHATNQTARRHIAASSCETSQRSYWGGVYQSLRVRPGTSPKD